MKKTSKNFDPLSKRTVLESILLRHDHKHYPVDRETFMIIVTLVFRVIEEMWLTINAREVFRTICSDPHPSLPMKIDEIIFPDNRQTRVKTGRWVKKRRKSSRVSKLQ